MRRMIAPALAHTLQRPSSGRARHAALWILWATAMGLALGSGSCLPPPIDDEVQIESGLIFVPEKLIPAGQVVSLERKAGVLQKFDVSNAYKDPEGLPLSYYWYVDWSPNESELAPPIDEVTARLTFAPCGEYDLPEPGTSGLPSSRRIMVVVTNQPLEDDTRAYLGAAEGARVDAAWWVIQFQEGTCP